jgi:hypothetical protein
MTRGGSCRQAAAEQPFSRAAIKNPPQIGKASLRQSSKAKKVQTNPFHQFRQRDLTTGEYVVAIRSFVMSTHLQALFIQRCVQVNFYATVNWLDSRQTTAPLTL